MARAKPSAATAEFAAALPPVPKAGQVPGDGLLLMDDGERIRPSQLDRWYEAHPTKVNAGTYHTSKSTRRYEIPKSVLHLHDEGCFPDEARLIYIGGNTHVMSKRCARYGAEVIQ